MMFFLQVVEMYCCGVGIAPWVGVMDQTGVHPGFDDGQASGC